MLHIWLGSRDLFSAVISTQYILILDTGPCSIIAVVPNPVPVGLPSHLVSLQPKQNCSAQLCIDCNNRAHNELCCLTVNYSWSNRFVQNW